MKLQKVKGVLILNIIFTVMYLSVLLLQEIDIYAYASEQIDLAYLPILQILQIILLIVTIIMSCQNSFVSYRVHGYVLAIINILYVISDGIPIADNYFFFSDYQIYENTYNFSILFIYIEYVDIIILTILLFLYIAKKIPRASVAIVAMLGILPRLLNAILNWSQDSSGLHLHPIDIFYNALSGYRIFQIGMVIAFVYLVEEYTKKSDETLAITNEALPTTDNHITPISDYTFQYRSVGVGVFLFFITCGIYGIYWLAVLIKQIKEFHGDYSSEAKEVLLYLFIPFYNWYWAYSRGKQMYLDSKMQGGNIVDSSAAYLILSILGLHFIVIALIQSKMNQYQTISTQKESVKSENNHSNVTKSMQELNQMLENGLITQEDYDDKKREFLNRM